MSYLFFSSPLRKLPLSPQWFLHWEPENEKPEDQLASFHLQAIFGPQEKCAVFGEVWFPNREELLREKGINPSTWQGSDRLLLATLWEREGEACLNSLVGRIAVALWLPASCELLLIRDRSGVKTLYYTTQGPTFWVAPRLRTLLPYHDRELDLLALRDYLCCSFVPGAQTMWRGVREVRPGEIVSLGRKTKKYYYQPQEEIIGADKPLSWHSQRLRTLLEKIVQEYLPEKEPVGVYLSGGLDSSCITALAAKLHSRPIHTYSLHFGPKCANELAFSGLVAQHCQTQHHILEITFRQMWHNLPLTMAHLDDPIGDPLTVPNFLLGQLAQKKAQVILNGEGGDPCFGGPKNQPMLLQQLYSQVRKTPDLMAVYLSSFRKCADYLPQLLWPHIWEEVKEAPFPFAEDLFSSAQYLNRLMLLNIKFKGADHILTKVSNLTSAADLQGLSPLFDPRVVELAMQTPPEYKLAGVEEKAVLKEAVKDLLPPEIIYRPKSGMRVPVQMGFRKYWQGQGKKLLLSKKAAIAPYLNQDLIREWLNFEGDPWGRYGIKLWLLTSLEVWLRARL